MNGRRGTAWLLIAAGLAGGPGLGAQDAGTATEAERVVETAALFRPGATPEERRASAAELIAARDYLSLRRAVLGEGPEGAAAAAIEAAAEAIRGAGAGPELDDLLCEAGSAERDGIAEAAIRALGAARDRDALRALLRVHASCVESGRVARAAQAARAITEISGRPYGGVSTAAWNAWWSDAEWLPEAAWQAELANEFRDAWAAEREERRALENETTMLYRRLHTRIEGEERTALLEEMLRSERRATKLAGLRLIEQSLLNGRPVSPDLGPMLAVMLEDESAGARRLAAEVALRVAPADARERAVRALRTETDPAVAARLMELLLTGAPDTAAAAAAESWIRADGAAGDAAARVIATAIEHDPGSRADFVARVRQAASARLKEQPSAAFVALYAAVAEGEGTTLAEHLTPVLLDATGAAATECARALANTPDGLARLAAVSADRPELRDEIAAGIGRAGAGLGAYRLLLRMPSDEAGRDAALESVWRTLSGEEWIAAAAETPSPRLRARLLSIPLQEESAAGTASTPTAGTLAAMRARALILAGDASEALRVLGDSSPAIDEAEPDAVGAIGALAIEAALWDDGAPPAPDSCPPEIWARSLGRLAQRRPGIVGQLAEDPGLRAHIRTSEAAESSLLETLAAAGEASASVPSADGGPDAG